MERGIDKPNPVVDVHIHIYGGPSWRHQANVEGMSQLWARLILWEGEKADPQYYVRTVEENWDPNGDRCIAQMDAAGIDVAVMMPMDRALALGEGAIPIEEKNRLCGAIAQRHAGRLYSFCGVDPRRPNAVEILRRGVTEWGLKGLKLYPPCGFYPNDPVCYRLYRECVELNVPVLIHTGYAVPPLKSKYAHPLHIDEVAVDFPSLRIILGHAGMPHAWGSDAISVAIYHPNVYLDMSLWYGWLSEEKLVETFALLRDRVGCDRVCFGTDRTGARPTEHLKGWVDTFRALPEVGAHYNQRFTEEQVHQMLGGNALRLLNLR